MTRHKALPSQKLKAGRGVVSLWVSAVCGLIVVGSVIAASWMPGRVGRTEVSVLDRVPHAATWLGLSPEVLAAAGVSAQMTDGLLDEIDAYLEEHKSSLLAMISAFEQKKQAVSELAERVQTGSATQDEVSNLSTVQSQADQASSDLAAARGDLLASVTAGWSSDQRGAVTRILANRKFGLGVTYAAIPLNETGAVALRNALATERQANRASTEVPTEVASVLSQARATTEYQAAAAGVSTSLVGIKSAWSSWQAE
jgi:hypothetical protein